MARELCAFTMLDATAVPAGKRRAFAQTAVQRWAPFADAQIHVEWAGSAAMAWAWSRGRVLGQDEPLPASQQPRRIWPETLFRGQPHDTGEQLLAMDQGVEGRVWRGHCLVASEWWPGAPTLRDWNLFRRGAGLGPTDMVPAITEAALSEAPWSAPRVAGLAEVAARHRTLGLAAIVGLATCALALQLVAAIGLLVSTWQVEREIQAQDGGLQRILQAREQAGRDAESIDALLALRPPAGQLELLDTVAALLPARGWRILEWRMPDTRTLEVDLFLPRPDPRNLVETWEAASRFEDVTVELGRTPEEVSIRASIVPDAPAADAAAPAVPAPGAAR